MRMAQRPTSEMDPTGGDQEPSRIRRLRRSFSLIPKNFRRTKPMECGSDPAHIGNLNTFHLGFTNRRTEGPSIKKCLKPMDLVLFPHVSLWGSCFAYTHTIHAHATQTHTAYTHPAYPYNLHLYLRLCLYYSKFYRGVLRVALLVHSQAAEVAARVALLVACSLSFHGAYCRVASCRVLCHLSFSVVPCAITS